MNILNINAVRKWLPTYSSCLVKLTLKKRVKWTQNKQKEGNDNDQQREWNWKQKKKRKKTEKIVEKVKETKRWFFEKKSRNL